MARRQHFLVLCVAVLLLTAGCSAADTDAAAAALAQAAVTPTVPQTSTNVASAEPDGVRVADQTAREKVGHSRHFSCARFQRIFHWVALASNCQFLRLHFMALPALLKILLCFFQQANGGRTKPAAAPSPAPAAGIKADAAGMPKAPAVSGKQPGTFPGSITSVPATPASTEQSATATPGSISAAFPGTVSAPVSRLPHRLSLYDCLRYDTRHECERAQKQATGCFLQRLSCALPGLVGAPVHLLPLLVTMAKLGRYEK